MRFREWCGSRVQVVTVKTRGVGWTAGELWQEEAESGTAACMVGSPQV